MWPRAHTREKGMSLERNKKLARKHIDLTWNRGHMALAEQLHSKDFPYTSSFVGRPLDTGAFLALVEQLRTAMQDLSAASEACRADADQVVTWSTRIGTIQERALGYSPGDKVLRISAMAFWTLTPTGQIREICTMFDMESFRAQLGLDTRPYAEKALPARLFPSRSRPPHSLRPAPCLTPFGAATRAGSKREQSPEPVSRKK